MADRRFVAIAVLSGEVEGWWIVVRRGDQRCPFPSLPALRRSEHRELRPLTPCAASSAASGTETATASSGRAGGSLLTTRPACAARGHRNPRQPHSSSPVHLCEGWRTPAGRRFGGVAYEPTP